MKTWKVRMAAVLTVGAVMLSVSAPAMAHPSSGGQGQMAMVGDGMVGAMSGGAMAMAGNGTACVMSGDQMVMVGDGMMPMMDGSQIASMMGSGMMAGSPPW